MIGYWVIERVNVRKVHASTGCDACSDCAKRKNKFRHLIGDGEEKDVKGLSIHKVPQ